MVIPEKLQGRLLNELHALHPPGDGKDEAPSTELHVVAQDRPEH